MDKERSLTGEAVSITAPVSYTHLDVYKRQEYLSCKGVGTKFAGSVCKNMVLRECNLNYANFDACKLENLLVDKTCLLYTSRCV